MDKIEQSIRVGEIYLQLAELEALGETMNRVDQMLAELGYDPRPEWLIRLALLHYELGQSEGFNRRLEEFFSLTNFAMPVPPFDKITALVTEDGYSWNSELMQEILVLIRQYVEGLTVKAGPDEDGFDYVDMETSYQEYQLGVIYHAKVQYAQVLCTVGREEEALALAKELTDEFLATEVDSNRVFAEVVFDLADFYLQEGLYQEAKGVIYSIEDIPDEAFRGGLVNTNEIRDDLLLRLALGYLKEGQVVDALQVYENIWNFGYEKGMILTQIMKQVEELQDEDLKELLERLKVNIRYQGGDETPERVDPDLLLYLAQVYYQLGETQSAEELLVQIIQVSQKWELDHQRVEALARIDSLLRQTSLNLDSRAEKMLQQLLSEVRFD